MPPLTTASSLQRVMTCQHSLVLPQVRNENRFGAAGTQIHEYLAECLVRYRKHKGHGFELPNTDGYQDGAAQVCGLISLERLQTMRLSLNPEVAYSYNLRTGVAKVLGVNVGRAAYGRSTHDEITGTADVEGICDGLSYVADYKTGFTPVPTPRDNAQILFAALCSMKTRGTDKCVAEVIRIFPSGAISSDSAVVTKRDIDRFEDELKSLTWKVRKAREGKSQPVESESCKYCPAFNHCPAKVTMLQRFESAEIGELTDAQVASVAKRLPLLKDAVSRLERIIEERVENLGGLDMGDGTTMRVTYSEGAERIDADIAARVLAERYGEEVAAKAQNPGMTKKSLREAVQSIAGRGELGRLEKEALQAIRDAGGMTRGITRKLVIS